MTKLIDFTPSDEHSLVSRILLNIHETLDRSTAGPRGKEGFHAIQQKRNERTLIAHPPESPNPAGSAAIPQQQVQQHNNYPSGVSSIARPLSRAHTDMEVDLLAEKRRKSKGFLFFVIVIATAAFIALALLLSNRSFN